MATKNDCCNTALELIGTPYHHQGRLAGVGGDCAFVPIYIAIKNNLPYGDVSNYSRIPDGKTLRDTLKNNTEKEVTLAEAEPGDILLMRFMNEPQHIAILMPNNQILHSYIRARKVVIHNFDESWREKVVGVFVFKNLKKEGEVEQIEV